MTDPYPSHTKIDAIVLAAGRGSRLGLPKALLPAGPGATLLSRALDMGTLGVDGRVAVVLGHAADTARAEVGRFVQEHPHVASRVVVVENVRFADGQSTSLIAGLRALPDSDGALVLLVDQPVMDPARLTALVDAFRRRGAHVRAVAAAQHGEQRTPVILAHALIPEVMALTGDQGARRVLRARPAEVDLVEWGDGPWFLDVDTWDDYVRVARAQGWDAERLPPISAAAVALEQAWAAIEETREDARDRLAEVRRLVQSRLRSD